MQLERKNYFYPVNMTYFVNSKHFPNMIGQKCHTPLSMRIGVDLNDNFRFFFHYIFSISQYTHYWNIGLTWTTPATGAIIVICFNFKLQTCIMTEVKILSWRRINCMLILYFLHCLHSCMMTC